MRHTSTLSLSFVNHRTANSDQLRVHFSGNKAFSHHHMERHLLRVGSLLPRWLDGADLVHAARDMERRCWRELDHMRRFLCLMATFLRSCSTMKTAVPPQSLSRSPCYLQSWRRAWLRWSLRRHPVPRPWNLISRRWRAC